MITPGMRAKWKFVPLTVTLTVTLTAQRSWFLAAESAVHYWPNWAGNLERTMLEHVVLRCVGAILTGNTYLMTLYRHDGLIYRLMPPVDS